MNAPAERVWEALVGRADVVLDALPRAAWPEGLQTDPPRRLRVRWPHTEPVGAATQLEITLHDLAGGTRVDLAHAGWGEGPAWEEMMQGHFAGWLQGLAALGLLVEAGKDARAASPGLAGRERYFASGEIPAAAEAVYRALVEPEVLERWSGGVMDGSPPADLVENRYLRWSRGGGELVMILRPTPRGTHCALAEYGVRDRGASARWPAMLERLARFLGQ